MKNKRTFKLLSKTTFIYLIFTFIVMFISAVVLTHEADEFIDNTLDHQFQRIERKVRHYLNDSDDSEKKDAGTDRQENEEKQEEEDEERKSPRWITVTPIKSAIDRSIYPMYADTLIENPDIEEMQRTRIKTVIIDSDQGLHKLTMIRSVEDMLRLRDDIFGLLIPAFILLAICIVGFNYLLSGYLFRPFNKILDVMRTYKVGRNRELPEVETTTTEFAKMQNLFQHMLNRIEYDYRHLKEYTENMAHEIQTPLAVIRNKTDNLIADDSLMNTHGKEIKTIYDETNHLSRLGQALNLITKIENGEFNQEVQVQTSPVIEQHVESIRELAALKSLSIETDLSEQHSLHMDPYLLDIVLKNLLRNAVSYGAIEGPIRIKTDENKLMVSNYGPPQDVPPDKMFQRFFRNNHSNASLGLGLSLVKKICDISGLKVDYRYEDDQHIFQVTASDVQ